MKYRVRVEIEYFIALCELPLPQLSAFDHSLFTRLRRLYTDFTENDAQRIKDIESVTNHDVKAIEYFIKEQFDAIGGLEEYKEFVHFGLTSQDINNTAFPLMLKDSLENVYVPMLESVIGALEARADEWDTVPMLAKTHGQPASPTRLGKEVRVFVYRLQQQLAQLRACPISAKFGGATGNYNAHHVAYPEHDWAAFGDRFVSERLGLTANASPHRLVTTTTWPQCSMPCAAFTRFSSIWIATSGNTCQWSTSNSKSRRAKWAQVPCRTK